MHGMTVTKLQRIILLATLTILLTSCATQDPYAGWTVRQSQSDPKYAQDSYECKRDSLLVQKPNVSLHPWWMDYYSMLEQERADLFAQCMKSRGWQKQAQ